MAAVITNAGDLLALQYLLNQTAPTNVNLHLYSNNLTLAKTSVLGNFTEVTAGGYGPITLTGATWTISTISNVNTASYPQQTFTLTGAAQIYGYYITDNGNATVILAEAFPGGPYNVPSGGGIVTVQPIINAN